MSGLLGMQLNGSALDFRRSGRFAEREARFPAGRPVWQLEGGQAVVKLAGGVERVFARLGSLAGGFGDGGGVRGAAVRPAATQLSQRRECSEIFGNFGRLCIHARLSG